MEFKLERLGNEPWRLRVQFCFTHTFVIASKETKMTAARITHPTLNGMLIRSIHLNRQ